MSANRNSNIPRERRGAPRFEVRAPAQYEAPPGHGITWNVSLSGARIENASSTVPVGADVKLRFSFFPGSFDTIFSAKTVRHTESGFAVQFTDLREPQLELLRRALPMRKRD